MAAPEASRPPLARVYLLIVLTTVFWGGTPVAGKLVIAGIPPLTTGVLRYGTATLALALLFWRWLPDRRALRSRDLWTLVWLGVLGTFLNHLLFFFALVFAPAAHGSIIPPTTSPIWTLLAASRLGREPVTRGQVVGMALCLVGVLLVVRPERLLAGGGSRVLLGDLLFLLGGASWGVYSFVSRVAMQRLSAAGSLAAGMAIGTVLLVPFALLERPWRALPQAPGVSWLALGYLTFAGTVLSFLWWNVAIRRVGAGRTAVFSNLVPVFGVLLAWLVLGERLTALQLVGGLLAVSGVLACQGVNPAALAWQALRPWTGAVPPRGTTEEARARAAPPGAP
jgi:drug/metabolite transporter (DMT)-like permease